MSDIELQHIERAIADTKVKLKRQLETVAGTEAQLRSFTQLLELHTTKKTPTR